MSKVLTNQDFLRLLCSSKRKCQKLLIKSASKDQIYSICEIILNILNGNIKVDEKNFKKLKTKRKLLRQIIKRGPVKEKKYLIQKGGFLQLLLPSIITGLATLISSFIKKE